MIIQRYLIKQRKGVHILHLQIIICYKYTIYELVDPRTAILTISTKVLILICCLNDRSYCNTLSEKEIQKKIIRISIKSWGLQLD